MSGSIYAATSGSEVQRVRMDILTHNLANMNTVGYKTDEAVFRIKDENLKNDGGDDDQPLTATLPVIPLTTRTDFSQGLLQPTGNPLDLAIEGDGFFSIQTEDGVRYTRNGSFTLGAGGRLTTQDGHAVMGEGGEISIDGTEVEFDGNGNVVVDGQITDRLRIVEITEPTALTKEGYNLFVLDEERGAEEPVDYANVHQGFLEGSNVNSVKIMTDLIEVMRGYESYQKIIRTLDENSSKLIAGVGSPS
ncbi:MAG: flagellar basal-body rod protein FlgF [Kiloniellales bacterium]|nr:flagellar basal-body rod protein FlgF [Desulfobacterales bacterium]MDJ0856843.1 flagellar basal-body rod protein FlgF [Desulfobacterales bacterium]MDJ0968469.1 flagellar basal-body rod protein FlgF [Kiloniellales bacterium]MDJ0991363.1 flagellar basal-body rod protein FlgF [Desulfobacterales bacterium]